MGFLQVKTQVKATWCRMTSHEVKWGQIDVIKPNELYCKLFQLSFLSDQALNLEDRIFATVVAEWRRKI